MSDRNAAFFAAGGFVAALFLAGAAQAITDTVFRYSAPQNGYYGLSPTAFSPSSTNTTKYYASVNPFSLTNNGNTNGCYMAGVNLPDGATIKSVVASYSTDTNASVEVKLLRGKIQTPRTGKSSACFRRTRP